MKIEVEGKEVNLIVDEKDGWYVGEGYAVNPAKILCQTYPWYADYCCAAPIHMFTILEDDHECN